MRLFLRLILRQIVSVVILVFLFTACNTPNIDDILGEYIDSYVKITADLSQQIKDNRTDDIKAISDFCGPEIQEEVSKLREKVDTMISKTEGTKQEVFVRSLSDAVGYLEYMIRCNSKDDLSKEDKTNLHRVISEFLLVRESYEEFLAEYG